MAEHSRKIQARPECRQFAESLYRKGFDNLSTVQQSLAATRFYIQEIHNRAKFEIAEEDIEDGMTDGSKDLGVDFIHREGGQVLLIQSKFRKQGTPEDPKEISHFKEVLQRIANPRLIANERLKDQLNEIDLSKDSFSLVFLTFGEIKNQAQEIAIQPATYPKGFSDLDERCDWVFLDEQRINEEFRNVDNLEKGVRDTPISLYR